MSDANVEREAAEENFAKATGVGKPDPHKQAGDAPFKKQIEACAAGKIGSMPVKKLTFLFPEDSEQTVDPNEKSGRNKKRDWQDSLGDEPYRAWPSQQRSVERWFMVFRVNLFMALSSLPQFPQFDIKWEDLCQFYDWLLGPEMGAKNPAPSPPVILNAERKVWELIDRKIRTGSKLSTALKEVQSDPLSVLDSGSL